ncbi:unnamed protein product [Ascophyllum nodosum]
MRLVASAAARSLAKAARRTARPGKMGEGISQGSAGRTLEAGRMRSIKTSMSVQTHIGATPVLLSNLALILNSSSAAPTTLEPEEGEEDDDGGRRNCDTTLRSG